MLWILGVILFLLMVVTGFMGYVLPWGQMSFWAATVITNLFSAIPLVGDPIVTWLWGGYAVGNPTLNRFYSLHYLLPFVIVGVVVLHIWALHMVGQNNPTGVEPKAEKDTVAFTPYATVKDVFFTGVFCHVLRLVRVLHPELSRSSRQLHSRQSRRRRRRISSRNGTTCRSTPFCAPSRTSSLGVIALRRLDRPARFPALARYLAGALGKYRPLYRQFLLDLLRGRHRPRLSRLAAAGGRLRDHGADTHRVLFRLSCSSSCRCSACSRRRSLCPTRSQNRYCAKGFPPARRRRRPRAPRPRGEPAMHARRAVIVSLAFAAFVAVPIGCAAVAQEQEAPPRQRWSFAGPFGMYDPQQLQRGFKIYREVCSACHSLKLLAFRNLADPGGPSFTEEQAAAVAAEFKVQDGPNDQGEMFQRPGRLADHFPPPFRQRSGGTQRQRRRAAAGHVGAGQVARLRARLSLVHLRCVHAIPGGRAGLHPRHSRRLCGRARRVHAAAGRAIQQIFSRPRHRHAASR